MARALRVFLLVAFALIVTGRQTLASQKETRRPCVPDATGLSDELLTAAVRGNKDEVIRLLDSGADINAKNSACLTALDRAIVNGREETVEVLLARGADVQARNLWGQSTLAVAVVAGQKEIAEMLLAHGVDVSAADYDAVTPLHMAAWLGNAKMVAWLLAKGANVNAKSNEEGGKGNTPLHAAAGKQRAQEAVQPGKTAHVEAAALLLANGADVNAKNNKGKTPLDLATSDDMKVLLRKHGAK